MSITKSKTKTKQEEPKRVDKTIIIINLMYLLTIILEETFEIFNRVSTSRKSKRTDNTIAKR